MNTTLRPAPVLQIDQWFNTRAPLSLEALRGKVVVLEAFQMLCPGCVAHGLPQAARVHETFSPDQVAVIGLHTVFEHHSAMTPIALKAFLHEYRIAFPVGVDRAGLDHDPIPQTMRAYAMRGTPTLILIDAQGMIRHQHFGQVDDLSLGAQIAALVAETTAVAATQAPDERAATAGRCDEGGCGI